MKQLTQENFVLCQQYLDMVCVVGEGFAYVISSFTDFSKTEGDLVLSDIFQALSGITQTNVLIERLLADDESVQQAIGNFQDVTDVASQLDGCFDDYDRKVRVITYSLYPAFSIWKDMVHNALVKYVVQ